MTKKLGEKFGWFGERFCLLCAAGFAALILLQTLLTGFSGSMYVLCFLGGVALMGALLVLGRRLLTPFRAFPAVLFALRFFLALAVILVFRAQPVQDFQTMYSAACQMAGGSREYLSDAYFYNWAYQTGFVAYEAAVVRLFGTGLFPLQVMNALWMGGTGCLVYGIGKRFLSEKGAMLAALFYALYPGPYFLSGVLTNQHIAVFFYYLAIWLLVREERLSLSRAGLAGAAIALGNVMRPLGILVVLAFLCWGAVRLLFWKGPGRLREAGALALAAAVYFGLFALLTWLVAVSGLNPEGLTNNLPTWKFMIGLNSGSGGAWNRADYDKFYFLPPGQAEEAMQAAVRERLGAGPWELLKLFWRKIRTLWASLEDLYWGVGPLNGTAWERPLRALNYGDRGVFALAFGLALSALCVKLRRGTGKGGRAVLLLAFLLCGYCAVHLLIEVQSRYRYFLMPAVFLLAGAGLELDFSSMLSRFRRKEKNKA